MAITRTQKGSNSAAGSGATLGVALTAIAASSLLAVGTSWDTGGGATGSTVTDDLSVAAAGPVVTNSAAPIAQIVEIWYYKNYGGGNRTITLNNSPAKTFRAIAVVETAGADTVNPLGGTASANGNSTAPASGNISPAPTLDGSYAFGVATNAQTTAPAFAAPFADVFHSVGGDGMAAEDLLQASAGNISATWTQASNNWEAICAGFNPASGGGAWVSGTRQAPGQRGPFDRLGFLASPFQQYSYVPVAAVAATILQRKTLSPLGTHTGGRQSQ